MSIKKKFQSWFYLEEDDENTIATPSVENQQRNSSFHSNFQQQPNRSQQLRKRSYVDEQQQAPKVVSLSNVQKSSKVVLLEPRVYAEAQDISEHLKNKRAVVVNLQRIDRDQGVRIIDFLSGTVYALGGDIQRIGKDIFLCVPDNVEVSGSISDYFEQ